MSGVLLPLNSPYNGACSYSRIRSNGDVGAEETWTFPLVGAAFGLVLRYSILAELPEDVAYVKRFVLQRWVTGVLRRVTCDEDRRAAVCCERLCCVTRPTVDSLLKENAA